MIVIPVAGGDHQRCGEDVSALESRLRPALRPDTLVSFSYLESGTSAMIGAADEAAAAPLVVERVLQAQNQGYDGVVIAGVLEPGLAAAREAATIPIAGAGQSGLLAAGTMGRRIAVLTTVNSLCPLIFRHAAAIGLDSRLAVVAAVGITEPELGLAPDFTGARALAVARDAIERDRADVILIGHPGLCAIGQRLIDRLGVPVIDATAAAVKVAEMMIFYRWGVSRHAYPAVTVRRRDGFERLGRLTGLHSPRDPQRRR